MDFTELAQAFKRATPSVWLPNPRASTAAGQAADGAREDLDALKVIMDFASKDRAFASEERQFLRFSHSGRRYAYYCWEAPKVTSEASFLTLIKMTRPNLKAQHQERLKQARTAFRVALLALIVGIVLVFLGIGGIFVMSLPVGVALATSSSLASIISAFAFICNKQVHDRLDSVTKELHILERTSLALHYIGYLSNAEQKEQALTGLIQQLSAFSPVRNEAIR